MFGFARYRYWGRRATVQGALALVGTLAAAHGAAPECAMTHLALQEKQSDSAADWLEKVSDGDYAAGL